MQQRQLRLGDILDDYCPRERRVTNHAVVAMIGEDVKQTRCTTCDADHEYKHAKIPRQRRKNEPTALNSQVVAVAPPKRAAREPAAAVGGPAAIETPGGPSADSASRPASAGKPTADPDDFDLTVTGDLADEGTDDEPRAGEEDGPVHRPLIRATLPRPAGQTPERPIPEFTMRQPAGRPNRFRPRHNRTGAQVFGHAGGNAAGRGGARAPHGSGQGGHPNRQRSGRKRSK